MAESLSTRAIAKRYEDVEAGDADAVYLATPPSTHRALAIQCLERGLPVLVEKPFASSLDDADVILRCAREKSVFCMEAMWTRFLPAVRRARTLIADGAIGTVCSLESSFAIADEVDPSASIFSHRLGGGALLHRAVYPISLAVHFLGLPETTSSRRVIGETGVDEEVSLLLSFPGGSTALLRGSLRAPGSNDLTLYGTRGSLRLQSPVFRPSRVSLRTIAPRGRETRDHLARDNYLAQAVYQRVLPVLSIWRSMRDDRIFAPYRGNGYAHQADEVAACLAEGRLESTVMPHAETLAVMSVIDQVSATSTSALQPAR